LCSASALRSAERATTTRGSRSPERAAAARLSPGLPSPGATVLLRWSRYRRRARQKRGPSAAAPTLEAFRGLFFATRQGQRRVSAASDSRLIWARCFYCSALSCCVMHLPVDYCGFRSATVRPCRWSPSGRHGVVIGARKRNPLAPAPAFAPV
jgi:hypothetical protein